MKHLQLLITVSVVLMLAACGNGKEQKKVETLEDMAHARVAVLMGSTHDEWLSTNYPNAGIMRIDAPSDIIVALEKGKVDAAMIDEHAYNINYAASGKFRVVGSNFNEPLGIVFNLNDNELRSQFNKFLGTIRTDGTYDRIYSKWFGNYHNARMPMWDDVPTGKPLKVAITGTAEGFGIIRDGKPAGFDIELIELFGRSIGRPIEVLCINLGGLIGSITSGMSDIVGSGITITKEREKLVAFSDPYCDNRSFTITMADEGKEKGSKSHHSKQYATMDDARDARIGVLMSSIQDIYITDHFPQAEAVRLDMTSDIVMALKTQQVDVAVLPGPEVPQILRQNNDIAILDNDIYQGKLGIGFSDVAMRDRFNTFLADARASGVYEEMMNRWMTDDESAEMPNLLFPKGKKPIIVGTTGQSPAFSFLKNGTNCGLDVELTARFAVSEGRPVKFELMNFGALIPALMTGRIDIIANSVMITPERSKEVVFSDPYYATASTVIVLKKNLAAPADGNSERPQEVSVEQERNLFSKIRNSFYNNLIQESRWKLVMEGLWATLIITFFAIILGTIVGSGICAMRMSTNKGVQGFAKIYITVMRGTPMLVLLMIFFYVVFASTNMSAITVAVITFALNMGAYSSEIFRTSIEGIDPGQGEAGIALGFTKFKTFIYIILPQAVRKIIPVYKGEAISLLKTTSIVGYIAVVDLTKASDIIRSRTFDAFFPLIVVAIIYFILAWLLGLCLNYINRKVSKAQ